MSAFFFWQGGGRGVHIKLGVSVNSLQGSMPTGSPPLPSPPPLPPLPAGLVMKVLLVLKEVFDCINLFDLQTNVTSFVLGSEEGPLLATTAKDFDDKLQGAPVKAAPSQSTSIVVSIFSF